MSSVTTPKKASPKDWHPADVIAAVRKKGSSIRQLSLAAGLNPRTLSQVFMHSYPKAQAAIAVYLQIPPQTIWPSRYEADGRHKRGLRGHAHQPRKSSAGSAHVNGNSEGAE